MPDLNWCMVGIEANLELKVGDEEGRAPSIRPSQVRWFRDRVAAGGYPMFAYLCNRENHASEVHVFRGELYEELAKAKTMRQVLRLPNLRVMDPQDLIDGLVSEMASWHDEVCPPSELILPSDI